MVGIKRRGVVISNCQTQPLKHALSLYCRDLVFDGFEVHLAPPEGRAAAIDAFVETANHDCDIVLAAPLSKAFGPLSRERIADTFAGKTVGIVLNLYFAGLHPDLTYLSGLNRRIGGPLGDYHSILALMGHLRGLPPADTLALYRDDTYRTLGYYGIYEKSLRELRRREALADVPFAAEMDALVRREPCFFSVNHPTSFLMSAYAEKVADWLAERGAAERSGVPAHPMALLNPFAHSAVFPVYPEFAAHFGLRYDGSYVFKPSVVGDEPASPMTLEAFVEGEYRAFAEFSREEFVTTPQVRNLRKRFPRFPDTDPATEEDGPLA